MRAGRPHSVNVLAGWANFCYTLRMANFYESVYALVCEIPQGRVMTYGQIAVILGCPRASRAVGYAMRASANTGVPWWRVINHRGAISARNDIERPFLQRELLEAEGVRFDARGVCELSICRWEPDNPDGYIFEAAACAPFH